jgi:Ca-activated chloride channel family protein
MELQNPWLLIFLPFALGLLFAKRRETSPGVIFSTEASLTGLHKSWRIKWSRRIWILRGLTVILIFLALARPQSVLRESTTESEGIDIVLTVDLSTSMLAEDFRIGARRANRIDAAKEVIKEFVRGRKSDRIGMVAFASKAYMVCPLTRDYEWLLQNLERVRVGAIEDGTAMGSGILSALNRLKDSPSKEKVIILLTDGRNNSGKVSPVDAAVAAEALQIKVFTIGAGSKGDAFYSVKDPFGNTMRRRVDLDIDEESLNSIASKTRARYFRATDMTSLKEIFNEINRLETTPLIEKVYEERQELFHLFLIPGLILLILEMILKSTILRKVP